MIVSRSCGPSCATDASASKSGSGAGDDLVEREHALGRLAVDDDHVLELGQLLARLEHVGQELLLGDDHARAGVGHHVADLLGRVLHVDRERRRADAVIDREVGRGGTRAGCRSSRATVSPRSSPSPARPAGERVDALAQLSPRPGDLVALGPDRDVVGPVGGGDAKGLGDGGGADRRARLRDLLHAVNLHRLGHRGQRPPGLEGGPPRARRARPSRTARCRSAGRCGRGTA